MTRISIYIDEKTVSEVEAIAKENDRSLSKMISILLQYAINEKTRRRKKDNSKHNSENMGTGNSQ